jgi:protein CMS1
LTSFTLTALHSAVKEISKIAQDSSDLKGQPALLVITGDAQRAADLAKVLRKLSQTASKGGMSDKPLPVAKLFARHFKIAEQEAFLSSNVCPIAVGTPKRVHDLLQSSSGTNKLKLDRLQVIILDASWTDAKMRTLLDGNETKEALCSLLACDAVQGKLKSKKKGERAVVALF